MSLDLPRPIAAYFAADGADSAAVAECFADSAIVADEGRTHRGRSAIAAWKANASAKYSYVGQPIAANETDGKTVVTSRVTGDFPGSPVDLRYAFVLAGDKIASLEIKP